MKYPEATILIAEDNRDDALLIQRALRRANLINPLQVVANGEQAIQYLKGDGQYADRSSYPLPELVLLDLQMPRVSGLEVLKWIRDQPEFRLLPIVILTSVTGGEFIPQNGRFRNGSGFLLLMAACC